MQPETYLLRFFKTEAKTPTNFVKQIFFAFSLTPNTEGKRKKNSGSIAANFYRTTSFSVIMSSLYIYTGPGRVLFRLENQQPFPYNRQKPV